MQLSMPLRSALRAWPVPALVLGLVGLWMNRIGLPLLGKESPEFLLGGWAGLVSFVWLGPAAGVLTTLLSLGAPLARLDPAGLATLVYLLEGLAARALWRRLGSLVLAVVAYWFAVGWLVDVAVYRSWLGLHADYVALLFVKQVFNGTLNALVAELALRVLGIGPLSPGVSLRQHTVSRIAFAGALTALPLGLFYAHGIYEEKLDLSRAARNTIALDTVSALDRFLLERQAPLRNLARSIEMDWLVQGPGRSARLAAFHAGRPEYLNLGLTDAQGQVIDMTPSRNVMGQPIDRGDLSPRGYFREARDEKRTAYAALILGRLHVREPSGSEPVLVIAEPLLDREAGFRGVLLAALDSDVLRQLLVAHRGDGDAVLTLFDQSRRVIASLDPRLTPGMDLRGFLPLASGSPPLPRSFTYDPPPDGSREARLGLKLRHSSYEGVDLTGWGLVVDVPAAHLHREVARSAHRVLLFFAGTLGLLYAVVFRLTRGTRASLLTIGRAAAATADGDVDAARAIEEVSRSPIAEMRAVAAHFAAMLHAVEEQKRTAASALARSQERLNDILEHSTNLFYAHTPDHVLTYVSPQSRIFLDCEPEEAMVRWTEFMSDHPQNRLGLAATQKAIETGRRQPPYEMESISKLGRRIWVEVNEAPVVRDGRVVAVVGALTDITARKAAEEQRGRAEERLRQAQRLEAVGQLAAGVAHEFNNLLGVVNGYADMLLRELEAGDPRRGRLERILAAGERAAALTKRLLAFSRKQLLSPAVLDVNQTLAATSEMLRQLLGEKVEIVFLPDPEAGRARVDPGQLDQVVVDLALNARDAMPGGGVLTIQTRRVELGEEVVRRDPDLVPGPYVMVALADTGSGMDQEARARVFEPFFTTKEVGAGTGLGLATVYGVVKQSGGHIEVESTLGRGTTFRLYLPRLAES